MSHPTHFIVTRWRRAWAVSADADRLSVHTDLEDARRKARCLTETLRRNGEAADLLDLTREEAS